MTRKVLDRILKIILSVLLFIVPLFLTISIWLSPEIGNIPVVIGVSAINLILSIAEVMFLVKAAIFPKNGKKWWYDL